MSAVTDLTRRLGHFYHCYADGNWQTPVTEHCEALACHGLAYAATVHVGYVGSPENIAAAQATVEHYLPGHDVVAESPAGWEQETLTPMWWAVQQFDGYVSYAHTKGASRNDPVDTPWRRCMEWHCTVQWRRAVDALEQGAAVAGCYWQTAAPSSTPGYGVSGMFGGNFWWTRAELLRRNPPPGRESRFAAEHWLGQLSEVAPLIPGSTIVDLATSGTIGETCPDW